MDDSVKSEEWDVILSCSDRSKNRFYSFPRDTGLDVVKATWAADVGADLAAVELITPSRRTVREDATIEDEGETFPGSRLVKLLVAERLPLQFEVYAGSGERRERLVGLSAAPLDLHPMLRAEFGLAADVQFRLRTPRGPLLYTSTLEAQGVTARDLIQLDLGFKGAVRELWANAEEQHFVYSSEATAEMLLDGEEEADHQRLLLHDVGGVGDKEQTPPAAAGKVGGRAKRRSVTVDTDKRIIDALLPVVGGSVQSFQLTREVRRRMVLLIGDVLREAFVWPTDTLGQVRPRCAVPSLPPAATRFDNGSVPSAVRLSASALPPHALLVRDELRLTVRLTSGARRVVTLPRQAAVHDLRAAVRAWERTDGFRLRRRSGREGVEGAALDDDAARLSEAGLGSGDELAAEPAVLRVAVQMAGGAPPVTLRAERRWLRFSAMAKLLSDATGRHAAVLRAKHFRCEGCSRRLCLEEEPHQAIPAACCSVRSLSLVECREMFEENLEEEMEEEMKTKKCQRVSFTQQHSPGRNLSFSKIVTTKFRQGGSMEKETNAKRVAFSQQYSSIEKVREMEKNSGRVSLRGSTPIKFKTPIPIRVSFSQQHSTSRFFDRYKSVFLPLSIPDEHIISRVDQDFFVYNHTPFNDRRHLRVRLSCDLPVTVADVRDMLSNELDIDRDSELVLKRKMVLSDSGQPAVRVCDRNGEPGGAFYALKNGDLVSCQRKPVYNLKLNNTDDFQLVAGRRCVIVVLRILKDDSSETSSASSYFQ